MSRQRSTRTKPATERLAQRMLDGMDRPPARIPAVPEPERMYVHHLGLEHLGRWISIGGGPVGRDAPPAASAVSHAGRLVGLLPGDVPATGRREGATRVIVLQTGPITTQVPLTITTVVDVAPREWS